MALRAKPKTIKNKLSKDLIFDGGIQSHTRSLLVKEFLKYILYERQQMPVPYEQVKQVFKTMEEPQHQQKEQVMICERQRALYGVKCVLRIF